MGRSVRQRADAAEKVDPTGNLKKVRRERELGYQRTGVVRRNANETPTEEARREAGRKREAKQKEYLDAIFEGLRKNSELLMHLKPTETQSASSI